MPNLLDTILAAIGVQRATMPSLVSPALAVAADPRGWPAIPATETAISTATVAQVRAWLAEHDTGAFTQSAALCDLMLRDADLVGALTQRLFALQGLPLVGEPADGDGRGKRKEPSARARRLCDDLLEAWPRMVSRQVQHDMVSSAVMLGYGVAQIVPDGTDRRGYLRTRLASWPSSCVEHRDWERRWYVHTRTGPLAITPGDGRWVVYTPRSERAPWMWGAIRCTATWYLRSEQTSNDAARFSEVHGIPVWAARMPSGARESVDGRAFLSAMRGMGRNAVVPLPRGSTLEQSYDLELIEAQSRAWEVFDFLLRVGAGKMRLAILGQDLTSQNAKVGTNASSETGREITQSVVEADAETLADCLREQMIVPWAAAQGRADLAPYVYHDAKPKPDRKAEAETLDTAAKGIAGWRAALEGTGQTVDALELAARFGVPLKVAPKEPPKPVTPPPATDPAAPPADDEEPADGEDEPADEPAKD